MTELFSINPLWQVNTLRNFTNNLSEDGCCPDNLSLHKQQPGHSSQQLYSEVIPR